MLELLSLYSAKEIIIFIVLLLFAARELFSLIEYFKSRGMLWFSAEKKKEENDVSLKELSEKVNQIDKKIEILMNSDRDDIKSWLVEKYNFYKENPNRPISHHTMDTIEKRYGHYKEEGGNSYIDNAIIPELRLMAKEENRAKV